jgi:hypothetical protein
VRANILRWSPGVTARRRKRSFLIGVYSGSNPATKNTPDCRSRYIRQDIGDTASGCLVEISIERLTLDDILSSLTTD